MANICTRFASIGNISTLFSLYNHHLWNWPSGSVQLLLERRGLMLSLR